MSLLDNFLGKWIAGKMAPGYYGGQGASSDDDPYGGYFGFWNNYNSPENPYWSTAAVNPSVSFSLLGGYQPQQTGSSLMGNQRPATANTSLLDMMLAIDNAKRFYGGNWGR